MVQGPRGDVGAPGVRQEPRGWCGDPRGWAALLGVMWGPWG